MYGDVVGGVVEVEILDVLLVDSPRGFVLVMFVLVIDADVGIIVSFGVVLSVDMGDMVNYRSITGGIVDNGLARVAVYDMAHAVDSGVGSI